MTTSFTQIDFRAFLEKKKKKKKKNSVGFIGPVLKKWCIWIRCLVAAPALLVVSRSPSF